jgi:hypothetical protein
MVEGLIQAVPVGDDDTESESPQQPAHQLATVTGPHEPERLGEKGVRLPYSLSYNIRIITDLMARPCPISAPN